MDKKKITQQINKMDKIETKLDDFNEQLDTKANKDDIAKISSGTPLFADSESAMIDTTKNYVNTNDGYLYTYNGTAFIKSNVKYQEMGLSDGQISKKKLAFSKQTVNLCDSKLEQGSFYSNGTGKEDATAVRSIDFIKVVPGSPIYISRYSKKKISKMFIFGYDENKKNGKQITTITNALDDNSRTLPDTIHYIKFYDLTNDLDMKIQIEEGNSYTEYTAPYTLDLDITDMPVNVKQGIENIEKINLKHENFLKTCAKKPLLTWIDDDVEVKKIPVVKKICDDLGIKCSFGCITNKLLTVEGTKELLLQYQNEGFHITSHSHSHGRIWNYQSEEYNTAECEKDLILSLNTLRENGFLNYDYLIAPYGANQIDIRPVIARYCKCSVNAYRDARYNHFYEDGRWNVNRIFIVKTNTLDFYKKLIDTAVINGDWLIFGTHSNNPNEFDENLVRNIMSYAKSKMPIMNLKEAWDKRKFVYDIYDMYN